MRAAGRGERSIHLILRIGYDEVAPAIGCFIMKRKPGPMSCGEKSDAARVKTRIFVIDWKSIVVLVRGLMCREAGGGWHLREHREHGGELVFMVVFAVGK